MGAWCSTQDFSRNTADQHPGQFAPIVRRHNDQVGPFLLGAADDGSVGCRHRPSGALSTQPRIGEFSRG